MRWRMTASFRATATLALRNPLRFASLMPQALSADHFVRTTTRGLGGDLLPPGTASEPASIVTVFGAGPIGARRRADFPTIGVEPNHRPSPYDEATQKAQNSHGATPLRISLSRNCKTLEFADFLFLSSQKSDDYDNQHCQQDMMYANANRVRRSTFQTNLSRSFSAGEASVILVAEVRRSENAHSITSSARASSVGDTSRPSAFGLDVDHQFILGRRLNGQVCRLRALEDAIDVACDA